MEITNGAKRESEERWETESFFGGAGCIGATTNANSSERREGWVYSEGREAAERHACSCGSRNDAETRVTTNTSSEGLQRRERRSTEGARLACDSEAATTNAESSRQSGEEHRQAESGQFAEASLFDYWQNFPTQSPLCVGNDGLFTDALRQRLREDSLGALSEEEIDKIFSEAYSELRKESIKAGGNAIVPQVAIELFKAISGYELLYA